MKLIDFFAEIFFKTDPLPLKDLLKNIGELNARTVLAGFGLDGIYVKLKQITDQALATAIALNQFNASTNLPISGVQQLGHAVDQLGGSSKDLQADLASLQMRLINMKRLGQPDQGLTRANFWLSKVGAAVPFGETDPVKVIDRVRHGFRQLSQEEQLLVLQNLGLSQSAAIYLRMTDAQWDSMRKNVYMSQEQVQHLIDMNKEWVALAQNVRQAGNAFGSDLAPKLAETAKQFQILFNNEGVKFLIRFLTGQVSGALLGTNALLMGINHPINSLKQWPSMMTNIHIHTDTNDPHKHAQIAKEELEAAIKRANYQTGGKRI